MKKQNNAERVSVVCRQGEFQYPNLLSAMRALEEYPVGTTIVGASGKVLAKRVPQMWTPKVY
jgi:hypothetical protein